MYIVFAGMNGEPANGADAYISTHANRNDAIAISRAAIVPSDDQDCDFHDWSQVMETATGDIILEVYQ